MFPMPVRPYTDFAQERIRAHAKHGKNSMEQDMPTERRLAILVEEVGEAAKEINDGVLAGEGADLVKLRKELVQVGAMAAAWIDAIDRGGQDG